MSMLSTDNTQRDIPHNAFVVGEINDLINGPRKARQNMKIYTGSGRWDA
jgi:hypothetical protein